MTNETKRQLQHEHQPRTLKLRGQPEPRLSRHDEDDIADKARSATDREQRATLRADLKRLQTSLADVGQITTAYSGVVPGDHRGSLRAVNHHARRLRSVLDELLGRL